MIVPTELRAYNMHRKRDQLNLSIYFWLQLISKQGGIKLAVIVLGGHGRIYQLKFVR